MTTGSLKGFAKMLYKSACLFTAAVLTIGGAFRTNATMIEVLVATKLDAVNPIRLGVSPIEQPSHADWRRLLREAFPMVTSPRPLFNANTSTCVSTKTLTGWKEISTYLRRGVRTAQRWEILGLPVHRVKVGRRPPVIAFAEELDGWEKTRPTRFLDLLAELKAKVDSLEIQVTSLKRQLKDEKHRSALQNQSVSASQGAARARLLRSVTQ